MTNKRKSASHSGPVACCVPSQVQTWHSTAEHGSRDELCILHHYNYWTNPCECGVGCKVPRTPIISRDMLEARNDCRSAMTSLIWVSRLASCPSMYSTVRSVSRSPAPECRRCPSTARTEIDSSCDALDSNDGNQQSRTDDLISARPRTRRAPGQISSTTGI